MSTLAYTLTDSRTMLRRNLVHMLRYPVLTLLLIVTPVVLLLVFVYVFGGTLGAGLGTAGRYIDYVVPGILIIAIASSAQGTAITVAMDMTEGIVARFRTMAISRAAVLTGHVLGNVIQTMIGLTVVLGVSMAVGFRPTAGPQEWLAVVGVLALISVAITWLSVALGMVSKSVEAASNLPMFLLLLPFLGSGFVPTESMPGPLRWFAENQPFTPWTETLRGLLTGSPVGNSGWLAIAWCVVITLGGYLWALRLYNSRSTR